MKFYKAKGNQNQMPRKGLFFMTPASQVMIPSIFFLSE